MSDYVRVRDKETGHHVSVLRSAFGRNPDAWAELKQPATYADGTPLPAKHKTSVAPASATTTTNGGSAADSKEK